MTLLVLRRTSMRTIQMRSVTAVSTTISKRVRFTLEQDTITLQQVDLLAGTLSPEEDLIRLVLISIPIVKITRLGLSIRVGI